MKKALLLSLFFGFIFITSCKTIENKQDAITQAYITQSQLIKNSGKTIIGYKAGLTSKAGQTKFKVSEPVAGVLFQNGLSHNRQVYLLDNYQKLMLETEIGFILSSDVPDFIVFPEPEQLTSFIDRIVPVIELPNLAYPDLSKVTGISLIENNVASNQVLIGKGISFNRTTLNSITTQLHKNGNPVIEGKATDAMGDQLVALHWLMSNLYHNGYKMKKGDLLITGALGKMIPAERGQYDANFSQLGQLSFSIR